MEQNEVGSQSSIKEQSELEKYKKNLHSNDCYLLYRITTILWIFLYLPITNKLLFLDLVVAYKKLTIEKNALEETLKASTNNDKDDVSETDTSEVLLRYYNINFMISFCIFFFFLPV